MRIKSFVFVLDSQFDKESTAVLLIWGMQVSKSLSDVQSGKLLHHTNLCNLTMFDFDRVRSVFEEIQIPEDSGW